MKDRTILVHNDLYALSTIIEADRDEYVELQRQQEGEASLFSNPASKDIMWKSVIENKNQYAILSASREFCGFVGILDESRTPEISIALLEKHRNKEIAKNAISLLVEKTYDPEYIDYYMVRIRSDNEHSRHVFEKMGAEYLGVESSAFENFQAFLIRNEPDDETREMLMKAWLRHADGSFVVRFRLDPNIILQK